jgi:RimJ/RimL family protein N-acetyltransferase
MQSIHPQILKGNHIQLDILHETHRETLRALSRDLAITIYSPTLSLNFDKWFDKAFSQKNQLTFAVRKLNDQALIGSTRYYEIQENHKSLAIGYTWYIQAAWGTTANVEGKKLLLEYAFEKLAMNRVEFFVDTRNLRSQAALKKMGALVEGTLRQNIILEDNFVRDTVVLSILKSEWVIVKAYLSKRLNLEKIHLV